jgi:hypothetical protein
MLQCAAVDPSAACDQRVAPRGVRGKENGSESGGGDISTDGAGKSPPGYTTRFICGALFHDTDDCIDARKLFAGR